MTKLARRVLWQRTHYSTEIEPTLDGKTVVVLGLAASLRRQGGLLFLVLQDKNGHVQVTLHKDRAPVALWERLDRLEEQTFVAVRGTVKSIGKAPHGAEIIPEEVEVLAEPSRRSPIDLFGKKLPSLEKRLDLRSVDLRRPVAQAIFRIRHSALQAARNFLVEEGFLEVHTPKIIASATEGGAALFPLLYYNQEAFLAQSPQLYKEQLAAAFEKVFEVGPIFRAEQFRTLRHLSESTSLDAEQSFVAYDEVMTLLERLVERVVQEVIAHRADDLKTLGYALEPPKMPLRRYTYDEALKLLEAEGVHVPWGEDLGTPALKALGAVNPGFYFIQDWPAAVKAFYIQPMDDRPGLSESFDLMYGSLELSSGGTRVSSKRLLAKRLREKGLNPKAFDYHLRVFDYGMPPHAGFGLGVDRLIMALTGQENIREVVLFPRDQTRLTP
ncbi:MAG: aspartate--tRNA(Asn) ligase [Candidatus Bathyarchaeia archaeon]